MEKKSKLKKAAAAVGNILLWVFLLFSLLLTVMVFSAQNNKDGVPSLFGKSLITVITDSMKPAFSAGDLIIIEKVPGTEVQNLQKDDIIIYRAPIDINGDGKLGDLNTHRIVENNTKDSSIITKGDNNILPDNEGDHAYTVSYFDVIGKYTGTRLKGVGNVINFLRTSLGFFLCIVLPLILFFLYELYNFISILVTERARKAAAGEKAQITKATEEEIKRKAIQEYLEQQAAAQGSAAQTPSPAPAEISPEPEAPRVSEPSVPQAPAQPADTPKPQPAAEPAPQAEAPRFQNPVFDDPELSDAVLTAPEADDPEPAEPEDAPTIDDETVDALISEVLAYDTPDADDPESDPQF